MRRARVLKIIHTGQQQGSNCEDRVPMLKVSVDLATIFDTSISRARRFPSCVPEGLFEADAGLGTPLTTIELFTTGYFMISVPVDPC